MKKILFTLFLALIGQQIFAADGGDKYVKAMQQALGLLDKAETIEEFTNAANRFERIGKAEKKEWLPYYYASFCYSLMVYQEKDPDQMDAILDRAEDFLNIAEEMKIKDHEKSELLVVKAMIASGRIQVDPQVRSMTYGPMIGQLHARAKSLNPDNPRAHLMSGQSTMFTPAQWGGGKDKAIPMLEEAIAKFGTWEAPDEIFPSWGLEMAEKTLKYAKGEVDELFVGESEEMEEGADKEVEGSEKEMKEGAEKEMEGASEEQEGQEGKERDGL